MLIHELTPGECRDVLSRSDIARLACSRANQPYVVPISFSYDVESNSLFSFSAFGKKVDWMRENANVCVEVEEIGDRFIEGPLSSSGGITKSMIRQVKRISGIARCISFSNARNGGCPGARERRSANRMPSSCTAFKSTA